MSLAADDEKTGRDAHSRKPGYIRAHAPEHTMDADSGNSCGRRARLGRSLGRFTRRHRQAVPDFRISEILLRDAAAGVDVPDVPAATGGIHGRKTRSRMGRPGGVAHREIDAGRWQAL